MIVGICCHCGGEIVLGELRVCLDCGKPVCRRCVQTCWHRALRRSVEVCPECGRQKLNEALMQQDLPLIPKGGVK